METLYYVKPSKTKFRKLRPAKVSLNPRTENVYFHYRTPIKVIDFN